MHHNDGVIPKLETTPRTDGKVKGRDTPKDTPARLVYLRPMRRAAQALGHGGAWGLGRGIRAPARRRLSACFPG